MTNSSVPLPPPRLEAQAHKGSAGRVLCVCGSRIMPGAALLVIRSAQRAGAGLVTLASLHENLLRTLPPASPETIYVDATDLSALEVGRMPDALANSQRDAVVVGPGLGSRVAQRALARLLASRTDEAIVVDADALNALAPLSAYPQAGGPRSVWTPHPGEAARLLGRDIGDTAEERSAAAREIARAIGGVCVLKGHATVVTDGEREYVNTSGNPGMATAGSGDVLAGILGAYLAAFRDSADAPYEAACAAVYVHGLAGDLAAAELGERAVIASDLIAQLPAAQREHEAHAR